MTNSRFLIEKKALDRLGWDSILWIFRFFLIIVIVVGVIMISYVFYSRNVDTREMETAIIAGRVAGCMIKDSSLQDISSLSAEKCGLNIDLEESYVRITSGYENFSIGNSDLEILCRIKGITMKAKPACLLQRYYSVSRNGIYADLFVATIKGAE
ncbi:MAG: hypothetical protein V1886_03680 [archaeon]